MFVREREASKSDGIHAAEYSLASVLKRPLCGNRFVLALWQLFFFAVLSLASYVIISQYVIEYVRVVGRSMSPNLRDADVCILNRLVYHVRKPHRFEIVVVRDPSDGGYSVKRVIAMPGECVYIRQGEIFINGERLQEPFLPRGVQTFPCSQGREQVILCHESEYVVLGDNRNNSIDSRAYGALPQREILGSIVQ